MIRVIALIDGISRVVAIVSAWGLFTVGLMLGYEVVARYFFNAPTIWAEELSRVFMIWAVFLGGAWLVRSDDHIRVTVLVELAAPRAQAASRALALVFVGAVAVLIAWNGVPTVLNSLAAGRSTGSLLNMPSWLIQASVPLGFALLALQAAAEVARASLAAAQPASPPPERPTADR